MLAQDLMGFGVPPLQAAVIANAGVGPINVTAKGSSQSTAFQLGARQYLAFINGGGGGWVSLPTVGGDNGANIGDDFVIHNNVASCSVVPPPNVTLNIGGSQFSSSSAFTLAQFKTLTVWAVSTTQWCGLSN